MRYKKNIATLLSRFYPITKRFHQGLCLAFALMSCESLFAQFPSPELSEETTQVSEHIYMLTGFPNIIFVIGEDATLVVDTGLGLAQGEKVSRIAQELSLGDTLYLTTTHFHPEHAAGEGSFPANTILIRPERQQEEMERDGDSIIALFKSFGDFGPFLDGVQTLRTPDITFTDNFTIDLGNVTIRLMWLGIAHTEGDELIYVEEDRTLITGDIVQNKVVPTVAAPGGSLNNWISILNQLEQLNVEIVIPTHSRVGSGLLISESRAFILDMRSRALALRDEGVSLEEASSRLTEVFLSEYPDWARNSDWNNVQAIPGFVQTVYTEAETF